MAGAGKYTAETLAFRAGVPLRTVRFYVQEKLIDPPLSRGMTSFDALRRQWQGAQQTCREDDDDDDALDASECIRIPMARGVELMVSQDRPLPNPRQLVEIALHVRKAFGDR